MNEMLTTAEAAQVLGTSPRMVQYFVREGRLKPARKVGRQLVFDPMTLAEFKPNMVRRNWTHQVGAA